MAVMMVAIVPSRPTKRARMERPVMGMRVDDEQKETKEANEVISSAGMTARRWWVAVRLGVSVGARARASACPSRECCALVAYGEPTHESRLDRSVAGI